MIRPTLARIACLVPIALAACKSGLVLVPGEAPSRITAIATDSGLRLFWDEVPGVHGYRVYCAPKPDGAPALDPAKIETQKGFRAETPIARIEGIPIPEPDGLDPDDHDGRLDQPAACVVTALRGNGESAPSPEVFAWRQPLAFGRAPVLTLRSDGQFGAAVSTVGDVDGDGREEIAIGAPGWNNGQGAVFFYRGGAAGPEFALKFLNSAQGDRAGSALAYARTWNARVGTLLVGAPGGNRVLIFSNLSPISQPSGVVSNLPHDGSKLSCDVCPPGAEFGASIAEAGNLDGIPPAFDELAVGAPELAGGAVFLYGGRTSPFSSTDDGVKAEAVACLDSAGAPTLVGEVDVSLCAGQAGTRLGASLAAAGNFENDPWPDLLLGAPGYDADRGAIVVFGVATGGGGNALLDRARVTLVPGDQEAAGFGVAMASVGDIDGDDRDEVAVASGGYDPGDVDAGRVFVFDGRPEAPFAGTTLTGEAASLGLGATLAGAPPVLADPRRDALIVGAPGKKESRVYLPAAPPGVFDTLVATLESPDPATAIATADVDGDGLADVILSNGVQGWVDVYRTHPESGPEVTAGPAYDVLAGAPMSAYLANFSDQQAARYDCTIDWGDGIVTIIGVDPEGSGCVPEELRGEPHTYAPGEYVLRITVRTTEGRSGQGLTRVRATAP